MPRLLRAALPLLAVAAVLTGCGGSDGATDPASSGPRAQAEEKLVAFGLTEDQASCIVEDLGADTVVEATDLNALTDSGPYRDAADTCTDGG